MKLRMFSAALLGITLGFGIGAGTENSSATTDSTGWFGMGISKAYAGRRGVARRTTRRVVRRSARRTTRRVARRTTIAGCAVWRAYYNCGGVYYSPIIESGKTVYIVVNP